MAIKIRANRGYPSVGRRVGVGLSMEELGPCPAGTHAEFGFGEYTCVSDPEVGQMQPGEAVYNPSTLPPWVSNGIDLCKMQGYSYDAATNECFAASQAECPENSTWDPSGVCIPNVGAPTCPLGERMAPNGECYRPCPGTNTELYFDQPDGSGRCSCKPGFKWQDPDPNSTNMNCIPSGGGGGTTPAPKPAPTPAPPVPNPNTPDKYKVGSNTWMYVWGAGLAAIAGYAAFKMSKKKRLGRFAPAARR